MPPCHKCRVELRDENEEVATVFMLTRRQFVTAENGRIVDINIQAVKTVMDLFSIRDQKKCLTAVINAFHYFLNRRAIDAGREVEPQRHGSIV
jgi:hypothetical protein